MGRALYWIGLHWVSEELQVNRGVLASVEGLYK